MSTRKLSKPSFDVKKNPKVDIANSYLKGYGRNKQSLQTAVNKNPTYTAIEIKKPPFVPTLGITENSFLQRVRGIDNDIQQDSNAGRITNTHRDQINGNGAITAEAWNERQN